MSKKILTIDDDPIIREMVASILKLEGYSIISAHDGPSALAILTGDPSPLPLDLIVCDMVMPGMTGQDVLREVRKIPGLATTPFMFLTAEKTTTDIMDGYTAGADFYLTKPFTRKQLVEALSLVFL